ncbi:MAG: redoxin domain-containing protein [Acidimicrobiaceae bacterium]|nr:redoxin domain-containing protein [Acidimicrobiaceae bacterium]
MSEPGADPGAELELGAAPSRRRIAPIIVLAVAAVLAGLFWVLAVSRSGTADELGVVDSPLIGRPAPSLRGTTIDGEPFDLARRKGSWVVLNFFQSDCVPCKAEHPELVKFAEQLATYTETTEIYTIAQDIDSEADVRAFFDERGGAWPALRDEDGLVYVSFGVSQVPETFIVDPDGVVRVRWAGQVDAITLSQLVQQQRDLYEAS